MVERTPLHRPHKRRGDGNKHHQCRLAMGSRIHRQCSKSCCRTLFRTRRSSGDHFGYRPTHRDCSVFGIWWMLSPRIVGRFYTMECTLEPQREAAPKRKLLTALTQDSERRCKRRSHWR